MGKIIDNNMGNSSSRGIAHFVCKKEVLSLFYFWYIRLRSLISFYSAANIIRKYIPPTRKVKEVVSQNVFVDVFSSYLILFTIETKFKQNTMQATNIMTNAIHAPPNTI